MSKIIHFVRKTDRALLKNGDTLLIPVIACDSSYYPERWPHTRDPDKVTCRRCKRTQWYKAAARKQQRREMASHASKKNHNIILIRPHDKVKP